MIILFQYIILHRGGNNIDQTLSIIYINSEEFECVEYIYRIMDIMEQVYHGIITCIVIYIYIYIYIYIT